MQCNYKRRFSIPTMKSDKAVFNDRYMYAETHVPGIKDLQKTAHRDVYVTLAVLSVWTPYYLSIAILLVLAAYVLYSPERRRIIISGGVYGPLVWSVPAMSLISSLAGKNSLGILISIMMSVIFVVGLYMRSVMKKAQFEKSCDLICACSLLAAAVAAIQDIIIYRQDPGYRPCAFASNANYYGMLVVFTILIALVRMKTTQSKLRYVLTIVVNLCALFMCESRSALLGCLTCVLLFFILERKYIFAGAVSACGLAIIIMGWVDPEIFSWANSLKFVIGQRAEIWHGALEAYVSDPLSVMIGKGPMTYSIMWESVGAYAADHAHNVYLDCLLNFGLIGTAFAGRLIYKMIKNCSLKGAVGYMRDVKLMSILLLAEIAVSGIPDNTIFWIQTPICFLIINSGISSDRETDNLRYLTAGKSY